MARLYGFIILVLFMVTVVGVVWAALRASGKVDRKWLAQQRREDELLNRIHGHNLEDVDESVKANRRHRERLEQGLDDLHGKPRNGDVTE